jgi:hypothetical protein
LWTACEDEKLSAPIEALVTAHSGITQSYYIEFTSDNTADALAMMSSAKRNRCLEAFFGAYKDNKLSSPAYFLEIFEKFDFGSTAFRVRGALNFFSNHLEISDCTAQQLKRLKERDLEEFTRVMPILRGHFQDMTLSSSKSSQRTGRGNWNGDAKGYVEIAKLLEISADELRGEVLYLLSTVEFDRQVKNLFAVCDLAKISLSDHDLVMLTRHYFPRLVRKYKMGNSDLCYFSVEIVKLLIQRISAREVLNNALDILKGAEGREYYDIFLTYFVDDFDLFMMIAPLAKTPDRFFEVCDKLAREGCKALRVQLTDPALSLAERQIIAARAFSIS